MGVLLIGLDGSEDVLDVGKIFFVSENNACATESLRVEGARASE